MQGGSPGDFRERDMRWRSGGPPRRKCKGEPGVLGAEPEALRNEGLSEGDEARASRESKSNINPEDYRYKLWYLNITSLSRITNNEKLGAPGGTPERNTRDISEEWKQLSERHNKCTSRNS